MATGVVKRILSLKGFGFIRGTAGQEYFFHRSAVKHMPFEELQEGQAVEFDVEMAPKGPRAENIRLPKE